MLRFVLARLAVRRVSLPECLVGLIAMFAAVVPVVCASVIHVEADGSGEYPTIHAAMNAAQTGDTILLGPGTYTGRHRVFVRFQNVFAVSRLKSGVTLESSHGPEVTVLDGEHGTRCLAGERLDASTVVRGLTLANGRALITDGIYNLGGGVTVFDSSPLLEGNIIRGCEATAGAGVFVQSGFEGTGPTLRNNRFLDNVAGELGGAVEFYLVEDFLASGNTFSHNRAGTQGGAGMFVNASVGVASRNIFWNNEGVGGAGGINNIAGPSSNVTGSCNLFWGNSGGAVDNADIVVGVDGNVQSDPLFCDPDAGDYHLQWASPCLPANSPEGCGLIGAFGFGGCNSVSVTPESWARVKARYR